MALGQVGLIGPRAEPAKQEKEQMSDMDKILQGLQLANGVMGIAVNYQTFQNHRAQNAALEDSRNGILSKKEALEAQTKGLKLDAAPTPGAIEYRIRQAEGDAPEAFSKAYFSAPEKTKDLKPVVTTENGKKVTKFVEPTPNQSFIAPPEAPPKDITVSERNTLQNQYDRDPGTKKNQHVLNSYTSVQSLVKEPSPAADKALIYEFMKALDPTSVVRPSEAEETQALGNLANRAEAKYKSMVGGDGLLTDAQRADIVTQVNKLAKNAAENQSKLDNQFAELAKRRGVDTKDLRFTIQPTFETPAAGAGGAPTAPKPGDVVDGYKFKGGNPADPKNWGKP